MVCRAASHLLAAVDAGYHWPSAPGDWAVPRLDLKPLLSTHTHCMVHCCATQATHTHNSWCTIRLNMHDMRLQMVTWTVCVCVCVRASASPSAAASQAVYRCIAPSARSGVWSSRSPSDIGGEWRPQRPMPQLGCKQAQPTASVWQSCTHMHMPCNTSTYTGGMCLLPRQRDIALLVVGVLADSAMP